MAGNPIKRACEGRDPHPWAGGSPDSRVSFLPGKRPRWDQVRGAKQLIQETMEELRPVLQHIIDECGWIVAIDVLGSPGLLA